MAVIKRAAFEKWLEEMFHYGDFSDYTKNGLQVEGGDDIHSIAFAVTFSRKLLDRVIEEKFDAIIVHHGFFGKEFLDITGPTKEKIFKLLTHGISLFGIHLPLDAHPELGNNAQLLQSIGAEITAPCEVGYTAVNRQRFTVSSMVDRLARFTGQSGEDRSGVQSEGFFPMSRSGISYWPYGPETPENILCISGGGSGLFAEAQRQGVDTFITGEIREHLPALAMDHGMNYICLGHYYSEKAGVQALEKKVGEAFGIRTAFIDIPNPL